MIDSVLKGTGNSRFLKSAVPAGTSWADALAMLQAGTFPIDFNGINTEGFQQVGTPLNKANLLKDATAAQIGLPPSTTPDGMFQALGNTGELHVWRKTVVNSQEIPEVPGSYTLGASQQLIVATRTTSNTSRGSGIKGALASNSLLVDLAGNVSLKNPVTIDILVTGRGNPTETASSVLSGYTYFMIPDSATGNYCDITMPRNTVYFVPSYATYDPANMEYGTQSNFDAAQLVTGVPGTPAIPAGTTTTYPVSTNPKAYQEGDDAKAAGYVVGEVVTGSFMLEGSYNSSHPTRYNIADTPTVSDDGSLSIPETKQFAGYGSYDNGTALQNGIKGKFIQFYLDPNYPGYGQSSFRNSGVVFIPENVVCTNYNSGSGVYIDRYQPVTGYAAIPAGTTIEYLGKLGDKVRVQVVSYVGTGTYGSDHPNSLTFGSLPEAIIFLGKVDSSGSVYSFFYTQQETKVLYPKIIPNGRNDVNGYGFGYSIYGKRDGNTISWYSTKNQDCQANSIGHTFYYLVLS